MSLQEQDNNYQLIEEQWWHRLLKVLMYASTLVVFSIASFWFIVDAEYYTYSYSFERDYDTQKVGAQACRHYERGDYLICGELKTSEAFLKRYLAAKDNDVSRLGMDRAIEATEELRRRGHSDSDIARTILDRGSFTYHEISHWDVRKVTQGILCAIGIGIIWHLVILILNMLIIYIAYGHTRIRKASCR